MMVSIGLGIILAGRVSSFGIVDYKYGFENRRGVTCFICESSEFRDLVCVILSD